MIRSLDASWMSVVLLVLVTSAAAFFDDPPASGEPEADDPDPGRFAGEIRDFERADLEAPPEPGGVVFVGSSSIKRWDLDASFPDLGALNRGFGGSHLSDVAFYANRVVRPYRPGFVVVYAGDNDIAAGKTPEQVRDDFEGLSRMIWEASPEATIAFLSIKPSPARWEHWPAMEQANDLIERACAGDDRLVYVDVASPMLGPDGRPRPELFVEDELHLNDRGYELWVEALRPALEAVSGADAPER